VRRGRTRGAYEYISTATAVSHHLIAKACQLHVRSGARVDEFEQEQIYFCAKDKSHTRLLTGTGRIMAWLCRSETTALRMLKRGCLRVL